MQKWITRTFVGAVAFLGTLAAGPAKAGPLDLGTVPADSKWVVHIDMDAVRDSASWPVVYERLKRLPNFDAQIAQLEQLFSARFPEDLHGITVLGSGFDEVDNLVQVDANVDRKGVENLLSLNPAFNSSPHGSYAVLSWEDKGKTMYGAFVSDQHILVGQNRDRVEGALDVMDKKADALKSTSVLAQGAKPGLLVYVAGDELAKLKQAGRSTSPILSQMQSAWATLSEIKQDVLVQIKVQADTAESAQRMRKSVEGIVAMLSLAADDANAKPGVKLLASLTGDVQAKADQSVLNVEWRMAQARLPKLIDDALEMRAMEKKSGN